jgi:broad specificity phosphatase PhoE
MERRRILLVRHCEVEERYRQVCYGRSDVGLSELGVSKSWDLAHHLAHEPITLVCHSGLARSRVLAEALASLMGLAAQECPLLRERDFGEWELRPWDAIHAATGDAMLGAVHSPADWRPPGGETTFEMRDRVLSWYESLPSTGVIAAVTHGGPIAALRGACEERLVEDWPGLVPSMGTIVEL